MPELHKCPRCGAGLSSDAPGGHCISCLLQLGLESGLTSTKPLEPSTENLSTGKPGDRISHYKLLQQIGEGGCGVVYMAEQGEPVRRRVALKVIKLGMDTKQVIARFEAERQALAMMDHPNIARVLDAGATKTGRPYFVMELVRGIKITDFCDQQRLSTRQRLELIVQVCQAVQHAHQKGIIHRDLKPSNILVTEQDGKAVPKIIDFGIAKATTGERLTDKTLFTAFEQFIGTPAYMSPEQAGLGGLDIDTRSDIYSLGVLLYELLTGKQPFDSKELRRSAIDEILRTIREKEPSRPSVRLTTLTKLELTMVAERRVNEQAKIINIVRGDLDWIVMKALEKDRARRYETAKGLAADIQRHLNDEPVLARPPGNLYQLQKLVKRHKIAFVAAISVTAAIIFGLGFSTWSFFHERQARERADIEAKKSQQVSRFLQAMLQGVGPSVALGRDTTLLREILDTTTERLGEDLTGQPEVEGELQNTIGEVLSALGQYDKAVAMHALALTNRSKLFGNDHPEVAESLHNLGKALMLNGKLTEAEREQRLALAMRIKLHGREHLDVATSHDSLGSVLFKQGKREEAEASYREGLALRRKLLGKEHPLVAASLNNLADVLFAQGKLDKAESTYRESLAMSRKLLGNERPELIAQLNNLAKVFSEEGKNGDPGELQEAESLNREALTLARKFLSYQHPLADQSLNSLAEVLQREGKLDEAEFLLREDLTNALKCLGDDDPQLAVKSINLGGVLFLLGRSAEAQSLEQSALTRAAKLAKSNPAGNYPGGGSPGSSKAIGRSRTPFPNSLDQRSGVWGQRSCATGNPNGRVGKISAQPK